MIVGTAGHIDHGKTTLVKALTGVDADRLPEEKARGITLDLGYAYVPVGGSGDLILGFVDVPGHEKLVRNMLAGATGIDYALLVVAADDGPMQQTREHLELLGLLGIDRGAVVLTKIDAVDAPRLAAAQDELAGLLAGTPLAGAPVFMVSAHSGAGIDALRSSLEGEARGLPTRSTDGLFRLAIDRSFSLAGAGTVVTGTAHAGRVAIGDMLRLEPGGQRVRVRSLHVQDRAATVGTAGQRCALALVGEVSAREVMRGHWLVAAAATAAVSRVQVALSVPAHGPVLRHWTAVHCHHGAADVPGRVALLEGESLAPGNTMLGELVLDRPIHGAHGDRFVLRDAAAQQALAGGHILDIFPPSRHKRSAERLAVLAALRDGPPEAALGRMLAHAPAGVDLARYAANRNLGADAASALWHEAVGRRVVDADACWGYAESAWQALGERLCAALAGEHDRAPDLAGVERERLRRMTLPTLPRAAFDALAAELLACGRIARTRAWLHLPTHQASVSAGDRDLYATLAPLLDAAASNPPRVRDVAHATGIGEDTVRQLFRRMARAGLLYPVAHDHYFPAATVARLADTVAALCAADGAARAASLRDRIGGGRKVAIHILEFFDRIGYTRRVRDTHMLRQGAAPPQWLT